MAKHSTKAMPLSIGLRRAASGSILALIGEAQGPRIGVGRVGCWPAVGDARWPAAAIVWPACLVPACLVPACLVPAGRGRLGGTGEEDAASS
jgi:hypothetical protein